MISTVIAILGTLAGAALAGWLQLRSQREDRAAAVATQHRSEGLAAVTALAAALADHRRAMWVREDLRLKGEDWSEARAVSHDTRSAITAPVLTVAVLLPQLKAAAVSAAESAYAMRNATSSTALATARAGALAAADAFTDQAARLLGA